MTNKVNGKVYIGQTVRTLEERRREHERDANNGSAFHFHNALRKNGFNNFTWEIIDTATTKDELDEKEKYWIAYYDAMNKGYNMKAGGEGGAHSEEVKKKIGEASKRMWQDEEHRKKISKKISEVLRRMWQDEEYRKKMLKVKQSEEFRRKMSEALKGRKLAEEQKKKISEALKGKQTGEANPKAKLTAVQAVFIRAISPAIKTKKNVQADLTQGEVGEWFGVSRITVSEILTGRTWPHLPTFEEIREIWFQLYKAEKGFP